MRLRKGIDFYWILQKIPGNIYFFSANVRQCNIAFNVVHVQVYLKSFLFVILNNSFLLVRVATNSVKRICVSGWFVQMENNKCTPNIY